MSLGEKVTELILLHSMSFSLSHTHLSTECSTAKICNGEMKKREKVMLAQENTM